MKLIARALAHGDDQNQSEFFNLFASELLKSCGGAHGREVQMCSMVNNLDYPTIEFIKELAELCELEVENRRGLKADTKRLWEQKRQLESEIANLKAAKESEEGEK